MLNPYAILGGALGGLLLLIGAYFYGRNDGEQIQIAKYSAVNDAIAKERKKLEVLVDQNNAAGETQENTRATGSKEIYREIQTLVDRPIYRNICIDADGVRSLDRAARNANGEGAEQPLGTPSQSTPSNEEARRDTRRGDESE